MAQRQKVELNFSDVDDFHFKAPLKGYITKIADDHFVINNDDMIVVPKRSSNRKLFPNCYDFSVGGHVNSGEDYEESAYRELKEELEIENVELQEVAYFSPFNSDSNTFQKVYLLRYTSEIREFDRDGIEKIYYKSKQEIQELMKNEPSLFKTDYSVVMKYLFDKNYL